MKRKVFSVALVLVIGFSSFAGMCTKQTLLSNADDILFSINEAKPLIVQLLPSSEATINLALSVATSLKEAIAKNEATNAVDIISELIPTIGQIVNKDINKLNAAQKTTILSALALANIGLHYLSKHLIANAPSSLVAQRGASVSVIAEFDSEPVWGERYAVKRRR
jgi:hypothetical protein